MHKWTVFVAIICSALIVTTAAAQKAEPYTPGHTINMYVGTGPGGMNDSLMRMVGRHFGKHVPGNPQVVLRNMPGAGGRNLTAYIYKQAPRNGTELAVVQRALVTDPLLVDSALPFEVPALSWIGTPSSTTDICAVWHTSPIQDLAAATKSELIIAGSGGETTQVNVLKNLIGAKIRAVIGYTGGNEMNLALERGEAYGRCALSWEATKTIYADLLSQKKLRPIVQFALKRNADLPAVPLVYDFVKSDIDRKALDIIMLPQTAGFPFIAPPGLLPDVKAMLRKAFDETMADPAFLQDAKQIKFDVEPLSGQRLEARILAVYSYSADIVARAKQLIAAN
jgi:tripartite-type tricarboxylate transporter receptor subunit TctC